MMVEVGVTTGIDIHSEVDIGLGAGHVDIVAGVGLGVGLGVRVGVDVGVGLAVARRRDRFALLSSNLRAGRGRVLLSLFALDTCTSFTFWK